MGDTCLQHSILFFSEQVDELYENFAISHVIDLLLRHVHWANALVQTHQPWMLVKSEDTTSNQHLRVVLHVAMETLRVCGILLQPMVPQLADRLLTRLGISQHCRGVADVKNGVSENVHHPLGEKVTLLSRIQTGKSWSTEGTLFERGWEYDTAALIGIYLTLFTLSLNSFWPTPSQFHETCNHDHYYSMNHAVSLCFWSHTINPLKASVSQMGLSVQMTTACRDPSTLSLTTMSHIMTKGEGRVKSWSHCTHSCWFKCRFGQ